MSDFTSYLLLLTLEDGISLDYSASEATQVAALPSLHFLQHPGCALMTVPSVWKAALAYLMPILTKQRRFDGRLVYSHCS